MKVIICIIINENNIDKINDIQNTWLKLIEDNINIYFIIDSKYSLGVDDTFIYMDNLDSDSHFNVIQYFKLIDYNYLLITYVNSFINLQKLNKYINTITIDEPLYIGGHGDYRTINNIKFWFHSYTPGIILNKQATNLLLDLELMNNYNDLYDNSLKNISGVAIGYYATIFNIKNVINNNFYYCNYNGHPCHVNSINKFELISCYNMSKDDMYNYYNTLIETNKKFTNRTLIIYPGGGLGNILFQYFIGYSLKKKYNCNVYYQINYNYWRGDINKYKILQHLDFINLDTVDTTDFIEFNEKDFFYNPIELEEKNYKITGYYQSYKYSNKYIKDIRNELFFNDTVTYFNMEKKYFNLKNNKPSCLIHVRRGDYLMYSNVHPTLKDDYYIKALNIIPNCKYFVFSDDINFIKNWSVIKNIDHEIMDLTDPEEILIFMSFCENFIIANSTLSLVAYLLRSNENAKLVAPKIWFGPAGYKYKIEDIIPENGILI